jgi:pyruvate,water dikinase
LLLHIGAMLCQCGALDSPEQVFELMLPEILGALHGELPPQGTLELVRDRLARRSEAERHAAPDVVIRDQAATIATLAMPLPLRGKTLTGAAIGHGRIRGTARIVLHPSEGARLADGEILVCPSTDPAWTPLFLRASALVMETGGYLSHGAIVARELGVPALINTAGALERISDGMTIEIDTATGQLHLLD